MPLTPDQDHLTILDAAFEKLRQKTWPGMAHFASTGPAMKTCRECMFWNNCGQIAGYYAKSGNHHGAIKPRSCEKFRELTHGVGPAIPHNAAACKYFLANDKPPPIVERN